MRISTIAAAAALATVSIAAADVVSHDVTGIESWDSIGDLSNTIINIDLGAALGTPGVDVIVDGVGWDVNLAPQGASWFSEMRYALDGNGGLGQELSVIPGSDAEAAIDEFDIRNYTSGGILDLTDNGFADITAVGGILTIEFFEGFDDVADAVDGLWDSGTITFNVVPAPGAIALLGLAGLVGTRRRRG